MNSSLLDKDKLAPPFLCYKHIPSIIVGEDVNDQ